jgi:hypothetical protein
MRIHLKETLFLISENIFFIAKISGFALNY